MEFITTYFLVPNLSFKPDTGPIAIGSIIADPTRPDRFLSSVTSEELTARYPNVDEISEEGNVIEYNKSRNLTLSIWAEFLQSIKVKQNLDIDGQNHMEFSMDTLITRRFEQDPEATEIADRIAEPKIRRIMKADRSIGPCEPVYMVTGIKIAKGLSAKNSKGKGFDVGPQAGVPIPTPVGDVGIGAGLNVRGKTDFKHERKISQDIVFAYQLHEIKLQGWRNRKMKFGEFRTESAFLSHRDDEEEEETAQDIDSKDIVIEPVNEADVKAMEEEQLVELKMLESDSGPVRVVVVT